MSNYLIVRSHAWMQELLPAETMRLFIDAKNLSEVVAILAHTEYGKFTILQELTAENLKLAYNEVLSKRIAKILGNAIDGNIDYFKAYLRKYEIENIIRILRFKKSKTPRNEIEKYLFHFSATNFNLEPLLNAETTDQAIAELENTFYAFPNDVLSMYQEFNSTLPLESHLKKIYYLSLLDALKHLPSEDRSYIEGIIKSSVDIENCSTAVAPFLYGYSPELIERLLIPYTRKISLENLRKTIYASRPEEILEYLSPYRGIVEELLNKNDIIATILSRREIRKLYRKIYVNIAASISYVLMYLSYSEDEWRDLSYLTFALQYNIPREEKEQYLITVAR